MGDLRFPLLRFFLLFPNGFPFKGGFSSLGPVLDWGPILQSSLLLSRGFPFMGGIRIPDSLWDWGHFFLPVTHPTFP